LCDVVCYGGRVMVLIGMVSVFWVLVMCEVVVVCGEWFLGLFGVVYDVVLFIEDNEIMFVFKYLGYCLVLLCCCVVWIELMSIVGDFYW